jgi:hypothetical protein
MAEKKQKTLQSFFSKGGTEASASAAGFKSIQADSSKAKISKTDRGSEKESNKKAISKQDEEAAPASKRVRLCSYFFGAKMQAQIFPSFWGLLYQFSSF